MTEHAALGSSHILVRHGWARFPAAWPGRVADAALVVVTVMVVGMALALASCDRGGRHREADPAARRGAGRVQARDAGGPPVSTPAPARRWLVVQAHEPSAATARYLPVRIVDPPAPASGADPKAPASALEPGQAIEHPAIERTDWPGHYRSLAAMDSEGDGLVVALASQKSAKDSAPPSWRLVRHDLAGAKPRELAIDVEPTALHLRGDQLYVGAGHRVGYLDLAAAVPRVVAMAERPARPYKAFDLLVRHSDWLVAIDDEVFPLYADSFVLAAGKKPDHRGAWDLPGVINGHYDLAALLPGAGPGDGKLVLVASYGIMDGDGHDLVALSVHGHKLEVHDDFVLQNRGASHPPVLEEHHNRGSSGPDKVLAGSSVTPWLGLALVGQGGPGEQGGSATLAIAAGERGILLIPASFDMNSKATPVAVGGACLDVLATGDTVHALVQKTGATTATIVTLRAQSSTLAIVGEKALPALYHRFVH